jgi:glycosyltransferase involved in cell wall biosynthesis
VEKLESAPTVSMVVCTSRARRARMDVLGQRLSAVLDHSRTGFEVVVVDNSPEADLTFLDPRIRVVPCTVPGKSRALTVGCIHARGEVLVFTDDDVEFTADWPERMAAPLVNGSLDAVAAPVRLGPEFDFVTSTLQREWLAEGNLDGEVRLIGAGMALHRRLFGFGMWDDRIGPGQPDFAFGEETLFEYMIRDAGARIGVVQDAEVIHHPDPQRSTDAHWRRMARQKGLSAAYVAHHWFGESMPIPALRAWRRRLRLRQHSSGNPGVTESELGIIESLARAEGFQRLGREPRAYSPHPIGRLPGSASLMRPDATDG